MKKPKEWNNLHCKAQGKSNPHVVDQFEELFGHIYLQDWHLEKWQACRSKSRQRRSKKLARMMKNLSISIWDEDDEEDHYQEEIQPERRASNLQQIL